MNGRYPVALKGVHGRVEFDLQRLIERASGERYTDFDLTEQFAQGYMSIGLQELSAYYSNRMSYEEVAGLVARVSGEKLLSDERIEQLVVDTAVVVSEQWLHTHTSAQPSAGLPKINTDVDVYAAQVPEVLVFEDGIGVKAQKATRRGKGEQPALEQAPTAGPKYVTSDVVMLEQRGGGYEYFCEGMDHRGQALITLEAQVRCAVEREYGGDGEALNVVAISDGARHIRTSLETIFETTPVVLLDWYHLCKKLRELMSMIALNKADKERHLSVLLGKLWEGEVESAITYLHTEVAVRHRAKYDELLGYLDKHRHEIIDYGARQSVNKPIGSGRMEKGVDQVIGCRQKKKGMAWSAKGSKALAILKVVELNDQWQQLWYPPEHELKVAA